jgi:cysteinyl-tRNA synthetase
MIKLYNTLTRKIEEFKPMNPGLVRMYTCGPTVYGPGHLGHGRSYVNFDLLKRMFLYNDLKVKHVLNITDVHDDMIKQANKLGITIQELAERFIPLFKKDLSDLNILSADVYPRVTEHIPEIIKMIKILLDKGYAYQEKDGSVYYKVLKFKKYGKLSGIKLKESKTGTRVKTDKYEKEEVTDFALWKAWKKDEPSWPSPWGKGRPGWHIECSVMANKYLGKTIDIHAGAMDLKFPHHENEIAQSEAANGQKFANLWLHAGLLEVENQKMSKSLGNYIEIRQIIKKGFEPLALRFLFLTAHYRSKMNFTWKSLKASQLAYKKLIELVREWREGGRKTVSSEDVTKIDKFRKKFIEKINYDLNVPEALAVVWEMAKSNIPSPDKLDLILDFDQVLGLGLAKQSKTKLEIPKDVQKLVEKREKLRKQNKWQEADEVRQRIEKLGWKVEDTSRGPKIKPV